MGKGAKLWNRKRTRVSTRTICTHTKGFDLCQNELSLCLGHQLPSHTLFTLLAATRFCAYGVTALTRLIFTAYHRLNIDLRMVSSSVWTSTRSIFLSFSMSSPSPHAVSLFLSFALSCSRLAGTPLSRSTDFLASRVRWYRLAEVNGP